MHDVVTNIDDLFGSNKIEFQQSEELFNRMADLIMGLEPDSLSDDQIQEVMGIIDDIEIQDQDEITEQEGTKVKRYRLANKVDTKERAYAKKYYRKNRIKIRKKKVLFKRSAEGRQRKRLMKRMAMQHKTPTGRRKTRYRRIVKKAKENK